MRRFQVLVVLLVFLLIGCGEEKKEELETDLSQKIELSTEGAKAVCSSDFDYSDTNGYVTGSKFVIYADDNNIVTRIVGRQIATSKDKKILQEFQDSLEVNYGISSNYGDGYQYYMELLGDQLIVDTDIDYTNYDMEEMAKDSEELKEYLTEDYKFTLSAVKSMYMAVGSDCKDL